MEHCRCAEQEHYIVMISAAVDGALSPEEHSRLMEHLADCPACREAYTQSLLLHDAFSSWEEPEIPGDLTAAVMTQIRPQRIKTKRRPLRRFLAGAACLALILWGAYLLPSKQADVFPGAGGGELSLAKADQDDALPSSASEGIPSAAPEVRTADVPSQEQLMDGVITYFNNAPPIDEAGTPVESGKQVMSAAPLSVPTLSSSDPALLSWMTANIDEAGYSSDSDANSAEATAWLISAEEYQALQEHIADISMDYSMNWGDDAAALCIDAASGETGEAEVICVIYIQAESQDP